MGQKDLSTKYLECCPDVFADIVNVFVYGGGQVVRPDGLRPAPTETLYCGNEGELRNQFHDVSKYQVAEGRIQLQYTLENEVSQKRKSIFRKAGYQGAVYREQLDRKNAFPFVSILLYWGQGRWRQPKSLHEFFDERQLTADLRKFVDNPRLHVYHMRSLPKKIRERFTSDMRIVVDYLAEGGEYEPGTQEILHIEAFLRIMKALTNDDRYLDILEPLLHKEEKGEKITMCELLDKYINIGISRGMEQGEKHFAKLMECLFRDGRLSDAQIASTDEEARKRLYGEYDLA